MAIRFIRSAGPQVAPAPTPEAPRRTYANASGISNVSSYRNGLNFIEVRFRDGSTYLYTFASTGEARVRIMQNMAISGWGLNRYIGRVVRKAYASKW